MLHSRFARTAIPAIVAALILSAAAVPAQAPLRDDNAYERIPQLLGVHDGVFDGRVLYVSDVINTSGTTGRNGLRPSDAFATIDDAINHVGTLRTRGVLDTTDLVEIRVLPGHTGAEAEVDIPLFDADIPNLWIRGYGTGTQRPKLTLSDDGAELVFDAANITFENFIVEQGVTALAQAISVTASADNLTIKDVEFTKSGTLATDTVDWINVAAGADDLTLDGITANHATTGTPSVTLVEFAGANARPTFRNFAVSATFSDAVVDGDGAWTGAVFLANSFNTSSTPFTRTAGSTELTDFSTPDGDAWHYEERSITMASGTTGSVTTHEVLTVTGDVHVRMLILCTATLVDTSTDTISFGAASAGTSLIGATAAASIATGDLWADATPTETTEAAWAADVEFFAVDGTDYGYDIDDNELTSGALTFYVFWRPILDGGSLVTADGTGTL